MKKIFTTVICICIVIFSLFGCGKKEETDMSKGINDLPPDTDVSGGVTKPSPDDNVQKDEVKDGEEDEKAEILSKMPEAPAVGIAGGYYYTTYILKDIETELHIPECPDIHIGEELYVCEVYKSVSTDVLKQRYEEFASNLDIEIEPVVTEESETAYQVSYPTGEGEVTGSVVDSMDGTAIVVRVLPHGFSVSYDCNNISEKRADVDAMNKYFTEDPFIKAVCAYKGITKPEVTSRIEYTINGDPRTNYFISDAGADAYTNAKNTASIFITDSDHISILFKANEPFEKETVYPAIGRETAINTFCEEYDVNPDDIYEYAKIGFDYVELDMGLYVPCYVVVCPGNNDFIEANNMDLSVYQEWAVFCVPAIDFPLIYHK